MAISNSYNYRQVNERLSTSGVVGANRLKGLSAEGYELLVNLLPDDDEYAIAEEGVTVKEQGLDYVHIPVDFAAPSREDYESFASALDAAGKKKTHIHCAANFRVSVFYSLYAVARGLWTQEQADAFVRDLWDPSHFPKWVDLMRQVSGQP